MYDAAVRAIYAELFKLAEAGLEQRLKGLIHGA